jgi:multiple sugar transport system permease protein
MSDSSVAGQRGARWVTSYVLLGVLGITMIAPLAWMALVSLQSKDADVMNFAHPIPEQGLQWKNYRDVFKGTGVGKSLLNSFVVTVAVTVGLVLTSSLAAFAFARMKFFGRDQIFLGYLATMMIPGMVTMIPVFLILRELLWVNTYWALIIPPMFSAYGVFLMRQFFLTLPRELEEAAIIDGCSTFGVYWRIVMPLSTPALAALGILTFVGTWRSFMWPLIVTHTKDMYTLPLALTQFQEMYGVHWTMLMAGSVIMIVPMLIIFILGQRFFVAGIHLGAVKG